jgi:hypothetical protein
MPVVMPYKPPPGAQVSAGHQAARNLNALWPLNEGGGATLSNAAPGAGPRNRLTLKPNSSVAPTPWNEGPFGLAPYWDSTSGLSGWYATGPLLSTRKNNISFGCWLQAPSATSPGSSYVMFNGSTGANGWGLMHSNGAGAAGTGLSIILDAVTFAATTAYTVVAGVPICAVATCDLANNWRLYINGFLFSGPTVQAGTITPTVGFGLAAASTGSGNWAGWIALPFVSEFCWSARQVLDFYLNSAALFPQAITRLRSRYVPPAACGPTSWPAALLTAS